MRNKEPNQINIWKSGNRKKYQSKGFGLINFESRLKTSNTVSDEIKRDINRMFGVDRQDSWWGGY